jgi:hypothetical protein
MMKKSLTVLLVLGSVAVVAGEPVLPAFPETTLESSALSLLDAAKQKLPPIFGPHAFAAGSRGLSSVKEISPKRISRMPIISPREPTADGASVKVPDQSKDYKITVIPPAIESVK